MKKLFLAVVMAVMGFTASAQVDSGFRMGVHVDLGMSNVVGTGDKAGFGYGLGWLAEYNFNPKLFLQSGIGFEDISHKEDYIEGTIHAYYLQIPIHVGYRLALKESLAFFVQAGPSLGIGIAGSKIQWPGGEMNYFDNMKRFDVGVGGRVGVEIKKFQISVGANYGVIPVADGYNNLTANLRVAYMF